MNKPRLLLDQHHRHRTLQGLRSTVGEAQATRLFFKDKRLTRQKLLLSRSKNTDEKGGALAEAGREEG